MPHTFFQNILKSKVSWFLPHFGIWEHSGMTSDPIASRKEFWVQTYSKLNKLIRCIHIFHNCNIIPASQNDFWMQCTMLYKPLWPLKWIMSYYNNTLGMIFPCFHLMKVKGVPRWFFLTSCPTEINDSWKLNEYGFQECMHIKT